jgi:xanthine dehydrogenase iron-sulfur cluster and FAD-binding subunit A
MDAARTYRQPRSLSEATAWLADDAATIIAGWTDVYPALVDRPPPTALLDLSRVAKIKAIARRDGYLGIGAGATWSELIAAKLHGAAGGGTRDRLGAGAEARDARRQSMPCLARG